MVLVFEKNHYRYEFLGTIILFFELEHDKIARGLDFFSQLDFMF